MKISIQGIRPFLIGTFLVVITSFYLFPVGFRGLPESMNGKQLMAVLGILIFLLNCIKSKSVKLHRYTVVSGLIAILFSVWCLYSVIDNGTDEYGYALYIRAYAIWYFGAYALVALMRLRYGNVDLPIITKYLAIVCVAQCILAQVVDSYPAFRSFVDTWFVQDRVPILVKRLYGIGASLDSAGVRFCLVQVLIAHQIVTNEDVTEDKRSLVTYIVALLIIVVLGNMMSRTTTAGSAMALAYIFVRMGSTKSGVLSKRQIRFISVAALVIAIGVAVSIYFYNTNPSVRYLMRFAFEGFFNWMENGEWTTGSTEKLNTEMWIWPHDTHGWTVGYGIFERRDFGLTDIGYCRFALYCGIPGLVIFSLFFIYNASTIPAKFKDSKLLAFLLLALTFIIWFKVSTDIFQLYALLFCIAGDKLTPQQKDAA